MTITMNRFELINKTEQNIGEKFLFATIYCL